MMTGLRTKFKRQSAPNVAPEIWGLTLPSDRLLRVKHLSTLRALNAFPIYPLNLVRRNREPAPGAGSVQGRENFREVDFISRHFVV